MKKLFILFCFIFCWLASNAQPKIVRSGPANTVYDSRLGALYNLIVPVYNDTASANLNIGIDSCYAVMATRDSNYLWYRQCNPKAWVKLGSGSGGSGSSVNIYNSDGSLTSNRFLDGIGFDLQIGNVDTLWLDANEQMKIIRGSQIFLMDTDTASFSRRVSYTTNLGSTFTLHTLVDKNYVDSVAALSLGTVTSVGSGFGLTGGPITTSGTLVVDTTSGGVTSWVRTKKVIDSLTAVGWGPRTWQQSLITGSVLTQDNEIDGEGQLFDLSGSQINFSQHSLGGQRHTRINIVPTSTVIYGEANDLGEDDNKIELFKDSIAFYPLYGKWFIDSLRTLAAGDDEMMTWNPRTGVVSHQAIPSFATPTLQQVLATEGNEAVITATTDLSPSTTGIDFLMGNNGLWNNITLQALNDISMQGRSVGLSTSNNSLIAIDNDSLRVNAPNGIINIDSLRTWNNIADTVRKKPMTWNKDNGAWEYLDFWPVGSGSSGLTIGTTTITSGSTKRILYDSAGTLSSNANFVYDFTNNRLGVGTESPSFLLHVYENTTNTTTAGARIENAGNGDAVLHFLQNTANYSIGIDQSISSRFYISASATLGTNNGVIIASDGKVGLNGASPAAGVTLGAGSASAFSAPLKFTSGTINTTAEAGTMEYNGNFYVTKVNAVRYGVGGSLEVNTTDVGNVGTGVDDLMSFSVPAGTMSTNGDYIEFAFTVTFAANANNKTVRVVYGATELYNSTAQAQNGGSMEVVGKIIRTGATTQKVIVSVSTDGTLYTDLANYTTAAETLSGAVTLKATGEATSNDDIVNTILTVKYYPNN